MGSTILVRNWPTASLWLVSQRHMTALKRTPEMDILSNRESATLIWIALGLGYCVSQPSVRHALGGVIRAFQQDSILAASILFFDYVGLTVWLLYEAGLWDLDQLKNTFLWALTAGGVSIYRAATNDDKEGLLGKWVADNLKIVVIIEFVVNFYSAPLLVELMLVPTLALLGALLAFAEGKKEYRPAARFLSSLLVFAGLILTACALYRIVSAFGEFATLHTLQDFYTPPLLSFLLLPFLFGLLVHVTYENAFLRLMNSIPDSQLRAYAKRQAALTFRSNFESLRRWSRNSSLSRPQNEDEVDKGIQEVVAARIRERNPPDVPPEDGWSPYKAVKFLTEHGLETNDYHRVFEDTWHAASSYLEIGDKPLPNNIAYYVEGNVQTAKRLKLVLSVNNPSDTSEAEAAFANITRSLLEYALCETSGSIADTLLARGGCKMSVRYGRTVEVWRDDWEGGIRDGYTKSVLVTHDT